MVAENASDFVSANSKLPRIRHDVDGLRQRTHLFYEVYEAEQMRKLAEASRI